MVAGREQLCVSPRQRQLHVITEAVAVLGVAPFLVWLATRERPLTPNERAGLWVLFGATLIVDGTLLYRWLSGTSAE
jgi:hypothetical protein